MAQSDKLLESSRLTPFQASLQPTWVPRIRELLVDFIGHVQIIPGPRLEDAVMMYFPMCSSTHVQFTMDEVAEYFALPTEGFYDDDDEARMPEATEPIGPLGCEAENSLHRFVFHNIFLSEDPDVETSRDGQASKRHVVTTLEGKEVAWGRLLWKYLVKRILSFQRQPGDSRDFFEKLTSTRLQFACTLGAVLQRANIIGVPEHERWMSSIQDTLDMDVNESAADKKNDAYIFDEYDYYAHMALLEHVQSLQRKMLDDADALPALVPAGPPRHDQFGPKHDSNGLSRASESIKRRM